MSPLLANHGYCVFALTYGTTSFTAPGYQPGGLKRMQDSAKQLKGFVGQVLRRTKAARVDVVGRSEGSLMPNYYVKFLDGARHVERYVRVTPLWDGTNPAGLGTLDQYHRALGLSPITYGALEPFCDSCRQFLKGSEFLQRMNKGAAAVKGVQYTMILTRNDELVIPYTSGLLEGRRVKNRIVQNECGLDHSEHLSIIFDPTTAGLILNALDPDRARRPVCVPVLPLVGAPTYNNDYAR